jgi:hypothetical protein
VSGAVRRAASISVLYAFVQAAEEGAIIGRLLAGYGELEVALVDCVQEPTGNFDEVLKALFRIRNLSPRINEGARRGRAAYQPVGLLPDFNEAIAAMRHCLRVRNQYAHSAWWYDHSAHLLAYTNLEDLAQQSDPIANLQTVLPSHVDLPLLKTQERFFAYTSRLFDYVRREGLYRAGKWSSRKPVRPRRMSPPPLHIP